MPSRFDVHYLFKVSRVHSSVKMRRNEKILKEIVHAFGRFLLTGTFLSNMESRTFSATAEFFVSSMGRYGPRCSSEFG